MKLQKTHYITIGVIVACILILIAWDIVVLTNDVEGDTISAIIYEASLRFSLLPYLFGMLLAHFFWPRKRSWLIGGNSIQGFFMCLYIGFIPLVFDFVNFIFWRIDLIPAVWSIPGVIVGHLFWTNQGWSEDLK